MSANSRMTVAIHILSFIVLWEQTESAPVTSDRIATSANTNPVVIRRLLGLLKDAGLVSSTRGANSGWRLAKRSEKITLCDIYRAVEDAPLFALHHVTPNQGCMIGRHVQPALKRVYSKLEEHLQQRLSKITLAEVFADVVG